jgi:hypothetical protein
LQYFSDALAERGHAACLTAVAELFRDQDYRLRVNVKRLTGLYPGSGQAIPLSRLVGGVVSRGRLAGSERGCQEKGNWWATSTTPELHWTQLSNPTKSTLMTF